MNSLRSLPKRAFSLIEVVIALGLVSFVLVALLGLFSAGFNSSRDSGTDTTLVQITEQVFAASVKTNAPAFGEVRDYQFNFRGWPSTNLSDNYYHVRLSSRLPDTNVLPNVGTNLLLLNAEVTWLSNTNVFQATTLTH